ncbi:response regulator [Aestuariispira insulae]|uniref:Response regulator receiver domain-containing protein n=1 Tax=Aestuariispira insulae TaxID=1461337 RepID=A0A3D9HSQ7_9PROT|nr:response regulator [Aestuariispira insulae]RED52381.1 response regulator receiver domain-containing protein [Aestuariispira insulae]
MPEFDLSQLNILLFDQDEESAEKTISSFENLKATSLFLCDWLEDARSELMLESRDLIAVDLSTSPICGLELIKALRHPALRALSPAAVLAFVEDGQDAAMMAAVQAGADCALAKPFTDAQLAFQVERLMQNRVPHIKLPDIPLPRVTDLPGERPHPGQLLRRVN